MSLAQASDTDLVQVSDTKICRAEYVDFTKNFRSRNRLEEYSSVAQSVEHLTVNQGVTGSSPVGGASNLSLTNGGVKPNVRLFFCRC